MIFVNFLIFDKFMTFAKIVIFGQGGACECRNINTEPRGAQMLKVSLPRCRCLEREGEREGLLGGPLKGIYGLRAS